jgi:uncharacterized protein YifE (UPF0438 family)
MYIIKKTYPEQPSKNKIDAIHRTRTEAILELNLNERLWKKYGGIVHTRKRYTQLTCQEANGSETITWTIEKKLP